MSKYTTYYKDTEYISCTKTAVLNTLVKLILSADF